eukprot:gnl/MRDRNA2_/MRDRNA2_35182_c0_seq2.p1 gnl/MRDRNA2_/MRDRNA2_35182_c0~~gnl/MRDRNA2_/MRDRNA2_35182_c0_seq2.p1  ORF type:complete len:139 (-),score=29.04 gnl/MRDRNA2_/MRDRNA2_35182_c0_seq2:972-1388(-)
MVFDGKKLTHQACGLASSVYASLVMPFWKHLKTFGKSALAEALQVSLKNATAGHGSSWQQGGTFVLEHYQLDSVPTTTIKCTYEWREAFPGDWKSISEVLREGLEIPNAPHVCFKERLDFVIKSRKGELARHDKATQL